MGYKIEIITKDKIKTSNWSGGTTNEIYIYPKDSNYKDLNFKWRISSATVELEHSTFTNLPKVYRYITTLEGSMDLCHNKGPLIHLEPFEVHGFSGDVNTESFGTVTDFNLMIGPGCYGVMKTICLGDGLPLKLSINELSYNCEVYSNIFYSPHEILTVKIDNKVITLDVGEALIVDEFTKNTIPKLELSSQNKCNLIHVKVGILK
ncbi:HutD family protein [Clostridium sp. UBA5988]|uniref:HutD/Ves family protein n=1 Tax=Clostridium sp. UBA5988 TaxID=1946369 RepID=UPI0032163E13